MSTPPRPARYRHVETRLTLRPGQSGTKKLLERYGERLVRVRYLYDEDNGRRLKTVELIVESVPGVGGGGFLMERRASLLDEYFVRATGARNPKVCFISTGAGDPEEWLAKYYKAFTKLGCRPSHLAIFRKPRRGSILLTQIEKGLLAQDAIYVGGGNTRSMLAVWRECCSPHFDGEPRRRGDFRHLISSGKLPSGIGIDDGVAVLYQNRTIAEVVSSRTGGTAYRVARASGTVVVAPLQATRLHSKPNSRLQAPRMKPRALEPER